jgi:hypothetical protein
MSTDYQMPFYLLFVGFGLFLWLIGTAASCKPIRIDLIFRAPWIGYSLLVGLLQLVHLLWPINRPASQAIIVGMTSCAVGVLMVGAFRKKETLKGAGTGMVVIAVLAVISFAVFYPVFNTCTKAMCHYDLGLYYLKLLRWTEGFPIVRGLVNVQEHLAFNQSAFLVTALVDSLVPNRWGIFLIGGFLPWLGLTLSLFALFRIAAFKIRNTEGTTPIEVAYAVSLPVWIFTLANANISSASPDCIISCLSIHFFLVFASYVASDDEEERASSLAELFPLGAVCLAVKSSCLGLIVAVWAVSILLLWLRKSEAPRILAHRRILAMALVATLFAVTWTGRGIILSGYPLFPSSALAMPVAWRMPVKYVDEFRGDTVRWAREADPAISVKKTLRTWRWLPGWFERVLAMPNQFVWPAQVAIAGSAALVAFGIFVDSVRRNALNLLMLIIPLVAYMLFWFFTAPGVRYFGPAMWILAVSPALAFVANGWRVGLASVCATLCGAAIPILFLVWEFKWSWARPEPNLPQFRVMETKSVVNFHGVELWVNPTGLQTYDAPLPSSNHDRPFLALLNPEKGIAGGFKFAKPKSLPADQAAIQ